MPIGRYTPMEKKQPSDVDGLVSAAAETRSKMARIQQPARFLEKIRPVCQSDEIVRDFAATREEAKGTCAPR